MKINILKNFFISILIISTGISLALIINGLLEIKFYKPPSENIPYNTQSENNVNKQLDYSDIRFIIENEKKELTKTPLRDETKEEINSPNIKLIGTLITEKNSFAIINIKNEIKFLREKAVINGFKVIKVSKHNVILEKNGKLYKLTIKFKKAKTPQTSKYSRNNKSDRETFKLDKRFVEEKTADIGKLLKDVMIVPVVKNGETEGFRLKYIKPTSILYKLGLRSGDLIVSVNGKKVRTVEEAFKIYNILRNENLVEVVINRKGKRKVLVYEIQ